MAIGGVRRRRGPMSPAQKAALKKAQEISARLRRGTGKPDDPSKPRKTAADYRAMGDARAKKIGLDKSGSAARKFVKASDGNRLKSGARSANPRTKFDRRSGNQTVTNFTPKQRAAAVKKASGANKKPPLKIDKPSSTTGSVRKPADITRDIADLQSERDFKLGIGSTSNSKAKNLSEAQKDQIRKSYDKRIQTLKEERLASRAGMSVADYKKSLAADSSKMTRTAREQNQGKSPNDKLKSNLRQTPGGSKPALGTADPATLPVSHILRERKELMAKQKSEGLTPEENKRLVAIKAESALRHQNRKAGKGTGPTKVALGDKKTAGGMSDKEVKSYRDDVVNIYGGIHNTGQAAKVTVDKQGNIEIDFSNTDMAGKELRPQSIANALARKGYGDVNVKDNKITAKVGGKPTEPVNPFKGLKEPKRNPVGEKADPVYKARQQAKKPPSDYHDGTTFGEMDSENRKKMADMRREMQDIARKWIGRDNVMEELNNAKTVGELVDAAQSVDWYLQENNVSSKTQPIDQLGKIFSELKKYSDRFDNNTDAYNMSNSELVAAIEKATGRKKVVLEKELKRRKGKATGAGVRQPPLRRSHNPRAGVFGADKWGRSPGGR